MKQRRVEVITEFLVEQLNHWMLFPLAMTIMGLVSEYTGCAKPDFEMWILTGFLPFLFYLARTQLQHFAAFLGAHIVVCALSLVIPAADICSRVLCILFAAVYLVYSFYLRIKSSSPYALPFHPAAAAGLSAAAVILLHYQGLEAWDGYSVFLLIGVFALYFVVYYLKHYLEFLAVNQSSTGYLPAEEMLRSGLGLVLGYTLLSTVVLILSTNVVWLEKLAAVLKEALFALLRAFFSLFDTTEGQQEITSVETSPIMLGDAAPIQAEEKSFWLWKALEILVTAAVICVLLYGCIRLLIALARFIRERFALGFGRKVKEDSDYSPDIREKCELTKENKAKGRIPFGFLSPQARIRKMYKSKLLSSDFSRGSLGLLTARESERKLHTEGMADVYEQARYSHRKMTAEDVKNMKNACK